MKMATSFARWVAILSTAFVLAWPGVVVAQASPSGGEEEEVEESSVHPLLILQQLRAEAPCRLEAFAGGVRCGTEEATTMMLFHPSLYASPRDYRDGVDGEMPVGPVELGGDYFYAIGQELLRFDTDQRALVERKRMPAKVTDLDVDGDVLAVTVEPSSIPPELAEQMGRPAVKGRAVVLTIDPELDEAPGRAPWEWSGTLAALHDVMWLDGIPLGAEPGMSGTADVERDDELERHLLEVLEWRQQRDMANPYLPLYRGEALERLGKSEQARNAFEEAVDHDQADWIDLLRIGLRLEFRGQEELAERAFDRSAEEMATSGVRGEFITAAVNATFALVWFRDVMSDALQRRDLECLSRVASSVDRIFPKLEGSPAAWSRLGAVFEESGDRKRAQYWAQRADEIRAAQRPDQLFEEAASSVDVFLVLQLGLFLTALFAGAILGLWRYEENEDEEDDDDEEGPDLDAWRAYLPRFQMADLASVAALFVVLLLLPTLAVSSLQSMVTLADAPPAASGDALAAPAVEKWAAGLAESPVRDELIAEAQAELEATKAGSTGPGELDLNVALVEAVEADTKARSPRSFADIEVSEMALQEFEWMRPLVEFEFETSGLVILFGVLAFNALIFGALLQAVARRFPAVGRFGRTVVPGAANSLGWIRLAVLASFVVGLLMMTALSQTVEASTEASLVALFGLERAPSAVSSAAPTMGFAMVVAALVVHAVGVVMDRRA